MQSGTLSFPVKETFGWRCFRAVVRVYIDDYGLLKCVGGFFYLGMPKWTGSLLQLNVVRNNKGDALGLLVSNVRDLCSIVARPRARL